MNRVTSPICPRCGAQLQPVPGSEQATCQYCGTTSFVKQPLPLPTHPAAVRPQSSHRLLFAAGGLSALVVLGIVGAVVGLAHNGAPASIPPPSVHPLSTTGLSAASSAVAAAPIETPPVKIRESFAPLVADVDADGTPDVVASIVTTDADRSEHFAAFSGKDGHELSRTPAIVAGSGALTAVVGRRLLSASRAGQLTGYGLATGGQQWTTALGARATAFCNAQSEDALIVTTDERRQLSIDLTTGRQSETKAACTAPITPAESGNSPRDRHDYDAPQGTESYRCGGVTVMGSENYTVQDQCLVRARIDTDRLEGLVGHRLWKVEPGWLVFGIRKPGAQVPMVGLISRGKLAWKATLPLDNPLEAQEGSPQHVGLASNLVVAAYAMEKNSRPFVTAFAVADGTRRFHVALPAGVPRVSNLATSASRIFIQAREQLLVLDASDGTLLAMIGKSN
jgi:DNA-directed RNA polymerase subunit RPC12/RpoP